MSEEAKENQEEAVGKEEELTEAIQEVVGAATDYAEATVQPVTFGALSNSAADNAADGQQNLSLLLDVGIPISVEVGRAQMSLDDILNLIPGSVVPLDKKMEEPVDLRVNGKLVARGEVVLVDDVYGLRITKIVNAADRIESLR